MPSMKERYQRRLERLRIKSSRRKAKQKALRVEKQKAKEADNKARKELMARVRKAKASA